LSDSQVSFAIGDWLVEPTMNQISTATESLRLRPQVMEVLVYLAGLDGHVATLESIHDELWSGKVVSTGTIYNCIAELRQAFARSGRDIEYIETLPKKGYRIVAPIVTRPVDSIAQRDGCSIAILPLVSHGDDADIEYLCDGIADEILHGLSGVNGLRIYSASALKAEELEPRIVGLRYEAQMVLSGRLQASGNRLRVLLRLENVSDGETVWSGRFDQTKGDLFELQESIARQVLEAVSPILPESPANDVMLVGSGTRSLDALNSFLLGKHALSKSTRCSQNEAIGYFKRATALDPSFARAYYLLYLANYMKCRHFSAGEKAIEEARRAAKKAELSGFRPPVPWVHIHRRLYPDERKSSRELALEAIEKLRGDDNQWRSFAYEQLTWVLTDAGLFDAAVEFAKQMLISPDFSFEDSDADEEVPHYVAACGRLDEAIRLWSSLIQKDPARPLFRCERSILYSRIGQFGDAAKDIEPITTPEHRILSRAFHAYYRGDAEETRRQHDALRDLPVVHPTYPLWTYCLAGDIEGSLRQYEKSVDDQYRSFVDFGNVRAMSRAKLPMELVDRLERHPKFLGLLEKEGIDDTWRMDLVHRLNKISDLTGVVIQAHN
jgi:DNA-binding winged helix-turn-helix (wHTH) protein/tetratricopeptide (TPR) repeat protein